MERGWGEISVRRTRVLLAEWRGAISEMRRRHNWPKGDEDPDVRLEWNRNSARFSPGGYLICGVRTPVEHYRQISSRTYPEHNAWWPAYTSVAPPDGRFWEGDNLKEYRVRLVETIIEAWTELAPLVDKALGNLLSRSSDPSDP